MKRIILIVNLLLAFVGFSFAQTTPARTKDPKAKATTASTATPAKPATSAAGPTKKDGTPDMRYKANKDAAKSANAKPATTTPATPKKSN